MVIMARYLIEKTPDFRW